MTDVTYDFIGPEPLTRITEDVWVNPNLVTRLVTVTDYPMGTKRIAETNIVFDKDNIVTVHLPLHEVVALLNGSA